MDHRTAGRPRTPDLARSALLTVLLGAATGMLIRSAAATSSRPAPGEELDRAVAVVAMTVGSVAGVVLTVGCLLLTTSALARVAGRSSRRLEAAAVRLTPAVLRRAVTVTVGAGLGLSAGTGVALATEVDVGWAVTVGTHEASHADAGGSPLGGTEPAPAPAPAPAPEPATSGRPAAQGTQSPGPPAPVRPGDGDTAVTVEPGDSLWSIAAAHLPADASAADVAAAWPAWHRTNRDVIGSDPDLIRTGQILEVPQEALATHDPQEHT